MSRAVKLVYDTEARNKELAQIAENEVWDCLLLFWHPSEHLCSVTWEGQMLHLATWSLSLSHSGHVPHAGKAEAGVDGICLA